MAVGAVLVAGFAAGRLRGLLGGPFGEEGGLTLTGSLLSFEQAVELLELGFEFGDALAQASAIGTGIGHGASLSNRGPFRCAC